MKIVQYFTECCQMLNSQFQHFGGILRHFVIYTHLHCILFNQKCHIRMLKVGPFVLGKPAQCASKKIANGLPMTFCISYASSNREMYQFQANALQTVSGLQNVFHKSIKMKNYHQLNERFSPKNRIKGILHQKINVSSNLIFLVGWVWVIWFGGAQNTNTGVKM